MLDATIFKLPVRACDARGNTWTFWCLDLWDICKRKLRPAKCVCVCVGAYSWFMCIFAVAEVCVSMCVCVPISEDIWEGKGKCFRGKWINSRIQQRHSKQPFRTPDRSCTMHMHVRETEEQGMEADKRREKKRNTEITTARGSDRAAETLVF